MNGRKRPLSHPESIPPHHSPVYLGTPLVSFVSGNNFLTVCGTTQYKPLQRKQLRSRRNFNFCFSAEACPIEDDCFLREPGKLRGLAGFQLCRHPGGFVPFPVHLFSILRFHTYLTI